MYEPMAIVHPSGAGEVSPVFDVPPQRFRWFMARLSDVGIAPLAVHRQGQNYQVIVDDADAGHAAEIWHATVGYSPVGRAPMPDGARELRTDTNFRVVFLGALAALAVWFGLPLVFPALILLVAGLMFAANRTITGRGLWGAPRALRWGVFLVIIVAISAPAGLVLWLAWGYGR